MTLEGLRYRQPWQPAITPSGQELIGRYRSYLEGNLEFIRKRKPQVVKDAEILYRAIDSDDLMELTVAPSSGDEPPSHFLPTLIGPSRDLVPTLFGSAKKSSNQELYQEMYRKYFDAYGVRRNPDFNPEDIDFFDESFDFIKELKRLDQEDQKRLVSNP